MLPDSNLGRIENMNIAKFADTGIPVMIDQLKLEGVQPYKLTCENCWWCPDVSIFIE